MSPDVSAPSHSSAADGLLTHARQLCESLLRHAALRVELLSSEFQEEKVRLLRLAMSAFAVCALLIVSLVMLGVLILAIYWETPYRVQAAVSLVMAFCMMTAGGGYFVVLQLRRTSGLFSVSAGELRKDADAVASIHLAPHE